MAETIIIKPQPGPQEAFLATPADIAIYGGEAGGGKTWSLIVEPLRHINNPRFRAVIFRREFPQITNAGGLYDSTMQLYPSLGGVASQPSSGITWTFDSSARIRLTHMQLEKDRFNWQGAEIDFVAFDELIHFTEAQFWYILSRTRSTSGIAPYIRAATNPEPGWVCDLLDWWIDDDGYAIQERSGVLRWFIRVDDELTWANSKQELIDEHPDALPKSLTFIHASLDDNQILMRLDPQYLANLQALPYMDRIRLLDGNWRVQVGGGDIFNRSWFTIMGSADAPKGGRWVRYWDLAATAKKAADYTAGIFMQRVDDTYYLHDCIAEQAGPAEADNLMKGTAQRDREHVQRMGGTYAIRWEREGGASGVQENRRLTAMFAGYDCGGERPQGDKITRAKGLAAQSEQGFVVLVAGAWNMRWLDHMHNQPNWPNDDIMDGSSGAFRALSGPVMKKPTSHSGSGRGH